jgi:hypothetical protein
VSLCSLPLCAKEHTCPICYPLPNHSVFHSSSLSCAPAPWSPCPGRARASSAHTTAASSALGRLHPALPHPTPGKVFSPPPQLLQRLAGFAPPSPGRAWLALPRPRPARPGRCRPARPPRSWSLLLLLRSSARAPAGAAPPIRPGPDLSRHCCAHPPRLRLAPPHPGPPGLCTGCPGIGSPDPVLLFTSLLLLFPGSVFYSIMLNTLALALIECIVMKVGLNGRALFLFSMVNEVAM